MGTKPTLIAIGVRLDPTHYFAILLPVLMVLAVALLGSSSRLGFWLTLILSIVLTPIGGFIAAVISGPRRRKPKKRKQTQPDGEQEG